jgi:hypothetical protein
VDLFTPSYFFQSLPACPEPRLFKGTVPRDFRLHVFFMN